VVSIAFAAPLQAQTSAGAFELSDAVQLDELASAGKSHLERMQAARAAGRWSEVLDILRLVQEQYGEQIMLVGPWRGVSVRDYCHQQIAALPEEARKLYREQVDAQAEAWYAEASAAADERQLARLVRESFCSSPGDDAINLLAEIALERGDTAEARRRWEQLVPQPAEPDGLPRQLAYPDTNIDLAGIRARLTLVSILDGDLERAAGELARLKELHPGARGRFGGRETVYAEHLERLLTDAKAWPNAAAQSDDWPTFAGNSARNRVLPEAIDVGAPLWEPITIGAPSANQGIATGLAQSRRVGEERGALLSYHPLIVGELLLVSNEDRVLAYNLRTGKPAWGESAVIYPGEDAAPAAPANRGFFARGSLGVPRHTLTAHGNKLFARMGSQVTSTIQGAPAVPTTGQIVCLDLQAEGRLLWSIAPPEEAWAFEGTPLCDGTYIYVALRRSEVNPQAYVACYDAETGQPVWRRFVCAAQDPARGMVEQYTHQLLTLAQGTLYFNTNLGCVAAIDARDGQVAWIAKYPRAKSGDLARPAAHFYRDLTPCVYDRGRVFVAPADADRIFALDAGSGRALWEAPHADDVVQLLGVGAGRLLASGDRLWWIDAENGKVVHVWPEQGSPRGFGRGLLAGKNVYWPTRSAINVFDQRTGAAVDLMELRRRLPEGQDASGGNLVAGAGVLVIATPTRLQAFSRFGRTGATPAEK
jgi:outer membrane protein assembly factor BamB